jgi:hypothetical protein
MSRSILLSVAVLAALAAPARADVNKFQTTGFFLESGAPGDLLTATGSFNTKSDKLKVRIKCAKGCALGGRAKLECSVGEGFYFDCTGHVRRKCEVSGRLYQQGFEGTFTCGDRTGMWSFGNP